MSRSRWSAAGRGIRFAIVAVIALSQQFMPPAPSRAEPEGPEAVDVVFPQRYTITQRGNAAVIGNTSETCNGQPTTNGYSCVGAQNGLNVGLNDKFNMAYIDVDGDATTFNSTRATLNLPPAAEVTFAILYWGGNVAAGVNGAAPPNVGISNTVRLASPGSGYLTVTGTIVGIDNTTGLSRVYVAYSDVTRQVRGAGSGAYTVANVQAGTGIRDDAGESGGLFAGWALLVVYRDPSQPLRNFTIWDSVLRVSPNTTGTIEVKDFLTPLSGAFDAKVGVVAFEGDLGLVGDQARVNGVNLSNGQNPSNNMFNGSVTNLGVQSPRQPAYTNSLGFDADTFSAVGIIPNGSTSATILLPTNGDNFFPAAVLFAVEVFEPSLEIVKTATDVNGGVVNPGDVLRYTVAITNTGVDTATGVLITDLIPDDTSYTDNSLEVDHDPSGNIGPKTDAAGDDTAEHVPAPDSVRFRLGTGANAVTGGHIGPNQSAQVGFKVMVDPATPDGTILTNTAVVNYGGTVITANFELSATFTITNLVIAPDLSLSKTDGGFVASPGDTVVYTLTATNRARVSTADGVIVSETLPAHTTFVGPPEWTPAGSNTYVRSLASMAAGETRELTFAVKVNSDWPVGLTQIANLAVIRDDGTRGTDIHPGDNVATDTTPVVLKNLTIAKTDGGVSVFPGDAVVYTITVQNWATRTVANQVLITEQLPALTMLIGPPDWQPTGVLGQYVRNLGVLPPGVATEVTLAVSLATNWPLSADVITNTAIVGDDGSTGPETNLSDNIAIETTPVLFKNISVAKTDGGATAIPGNVVVYTITARNLSLQTAVANVVLTETLPALTTLAGPPEWLPAGAPGQYARNIGTLPPGATRDVTIAVRLNSDWPTDVRLITNTVVIGDDGTRGPDTITSDNIAIETTPLTFLDLSITKTDGGAFGSQGGTVVYTLTARNKSGLAMATGVLVTDVLPANVVFAGPNSWAPADAQTWVRALGTLAPGAQTQFTIAVRLNSPWPMSVPVITNTAEIRDDGANGPDLVPSDNVAIETTPVRFADLSITKTNGVTNVAETAYTTYTVVVHNAGPANVVGARVIDEPSDDLINVSWTCRADPGATCAAASGTGAISMTINLAANTSVTFTVTGQAVECEGFIENTARVYPPSDIVDPNLDNNEAVDRDTVGPGANVSTVLELVPVAADAHLRQPYAHRVFAGQNTSYRLTILNEGPHAASSVSVTLMLPPAVTYVSSQPSQGSYSPFTGRWNVGAMAVGAVVTLDVVVYVPETLVNAVEVDAMARVMAAPVGNSPRYTSLTVVVGGTPSTLFNSFFPAVMR